MLKTLNYVIVRRSSSFFKTLAPSSSFLHPVLDMHLVQNESNPKQMSQGHMLNFCP